MDALKCFGFYCVLHATELALSPGNSGNEGCPHCPLLSSPAWLLQTHAYSCFYGSIHLISGLPLFLLPSFFLSTIVCSKEPCFLMMCLKQHNSSFVMFAFSNVSGLMCSGTNLFIFLVVQGIHRPLLQHCPTSITVKSPFFRNIMCEERCEYIHGAWCTCGLAASSQLLFLVLLLTAAYSMESLVQPILISEMK